jgi:hypothetical protein
MGNLDSCEHIKSAGHKGAGKAGGVMVLANAYLNVRGKFRKMNIVCDRNGILEGHISSS